MHVWPSPFDPLLPQHLNMYSRIQQLEEDKLLFKDHYACACTSDGSLTALNSPLKDTSNGWTKLDRASRRNEDNACLRGSIGSLDTDNIWHLTNVCTRPWVFVIRADWTFPHTCMVNPPEHYCLVAPSVFLEFDNHSVVMLLPFSLRNSQPFPMKINRVLYEALLQIVFVGLCIAIFPTQMLHHDANSFGSRLIIPLATIECKRAKTFAQCLQYLKAQIGLMLLYSLPYQ